MKPRSQPPTRSRRVAGYAIAVAGLIGLFVGSTARAEQQITLTPEQPFVDLPLQIGDLHVIAHSDRRCGEHPVDPYLQVRLGGQVLAADDDGAHSFENCVASRMRFSVPAEGYVLRVMSCCGRPYGAIRLEFLQSGVTVPTTVATTTTEESTTTTEESTTTTDATTTTVLDSTTTTEAATTTLWTTTSGVSTTQQTTTTTSQPVPTTVTAVPTVAPTTAPSIASSIPSTTTTSSTAPVTEPATTTTSSTSSTVVETTTTTSVSPVPDATISDAEQQVGAKAKYRIELPFLSLDIEVSPEQRQTVIVVNLVQTVLGSAVAAGASASRKKA